jgi:AcrR family transcriptional regulator
MDVMTTDTDAEISPKRRQIMEAARALFMAHGYGATSTDAIAREAGVSKATLYAYFPSKDALWAAMVDETCQRILATVTPVLTSTGDVGESLVEAGRFYLGRLTEPDMLAGYRMIMAESARFPAFGETFMAAGPRRFKTRLAAWLAERAAGGELLVPDAELAADQFTALLRTTPYMRATLGLGAPGEAEMLAVARAAAETFLRAYGKE